MYYGHNNNYIVLYYAVVACVYNSIHSCISTTNQLIPIYQISCNSKDTSHSCSHQLVETMYQDSNERVTIIVHTMGGPVSLYFLTTVVSQKWKDQYIYAYIPLSPAYAGAFGTLEAVLFGNHVIKNIAGGQSSMDQTMICKFSLATWCSICLGQHYNHYNTISSLYC